MSCAPANLLLNARRGAPDGIDVVLTALAGIVLLLVLAGVVVSRRMHRHAHHLRHTTSSAAPDAAPDATGRA